MRKQNGSLATQIFFITLIILVVFMAVLGIFSFTLHRSHTIRYNEERALAITDVVAANVDAAEFERIMAAGEKNQYWYTFKSFADETKLRTGVRYLYILANTPGEGKPYFAEGYDPLTDTDPELDFGTVEDPEVYSPMMFETLNSGRKTASDIYTSGDFGRMVSGFSPIINGAGRVVGVVGADLAIDDVMRNSDTFGLLLAAAVLIFGIIGALIIKFLMNRVVGKPIGVLTTVSQKMAVGDMDDIVVDFIKLNNEIGRLSRSFHAMVESTREQVRILDILAGGDLTVDVSPRCERDGMSIAMAKMIQNLGDMFNIIKGITAGVSSGAAGIAAGAEVLAQSSAEQSSAMEKLTMAIGTVTEKTEVSAELAGQASELTESIRDSAERGASQMKFMVQAVREIETANKAIADVIKSIDDIARQTNLLALNAAVEAARAGPQGKGFAVVADEVRVLAAKSAASAKDSAAMIDSTLAKASNGVRMAEETASAFDRIVKNIDESGRIVSEIARSAREQSGAIGDINDSIEHVGVVVQQNTATSEESAAASAHLSDQAKNLQGHTNRFRLRG